MPAATLLRNNVAALAGYAERDLVVVWREVKTAVQAREALNDVLPALIDKYGAAAGTVAADWYDELRDQRGIKRKFSSAPADISNSGGEALAGWAVGPLFRQEPDWTLTKSLVAGGLQRRIANFARATITQSSTADPSAKGWQRVGVGECDFCQMLIGRGAVYSEASADFQSHDRCQCGAEPVF